MSYNEEVPTHSIIVTKANSYSVLKDYYTILRNINDHEYILKCLNELKLE